MRWSEIVARPTDRQLGEFAATLSVVAATIGIWRAIDGVPAQAGIALAIGCVAGALGVWQPRWLGPVFSAAMTIALPVGWIVSLLVLALIFYGMLTPLALGFRLLGRDPLRRRQQAPAETEWQMKPPAPVPQRYLRQF